MAQLLFSLWPCQRQQHLRGQQRLPLVSLEVVDVVEDLGGEAEEGEDLADSCAGAGHTSNRNGEMATGLAGRHRRSQSGS